MEKIQHCDCFILNQLQDNLILSSNSKSEIKTNEFLSDYIPGKYFLDSPALYLITQGCFYSISSIHKGQNTDLIKHRPVNSSVLAFLVNSGKAYLLYPDHILIFLLKTQDPFKKVPSSFKLSSIVLIDSQVFVSTGNKIMNIMNDSLLINKYEAEGGIIEIKSGFINSNVMLVVLEYGFEVVNVDISEKDGINIELIFRSDTLNRFQVEFFNKDLLVFSDFNTSTIHFIDWTQSNDAVYSIELQDLHEYKMKVRKNVLLLINKEEGLVLFLFWNKANRQFFSIEGLVEIDFECLDFDYEKSDFREVCKLESSFVLNFFLSSSNSIHHFCLCLDLSMNFMLNYTFSIKSKSISLDYHDFEDKTNIIPSKNQDPNDRLRKVKEVENFHYPEKMQFIGSPNFAVNREDTIDKIHNLFTDENLKSLFTRSFSAPKINKPEPFALNDPVINLDLVEKIKTSLDEILRALSR